MKKPSAKLHDRLLKLILTALFIALCFVLPFLTGQIPELGSMLCPMHIPVLLCGFLCGWPWGLACGLIAPLLRACVLGMPELFPTALCMAAELATYGAFSGLLYALLPRRKPFVYCALLLAMLAGRLVWGAAMFLCLGGPGGSFTLTAFFAGAVTNALPGILLQVLLVPPLVIILRKPQILPFTQAAGDTQ